MPTDQSMSRRAVRLRRSILLEALALVFVATTACNLPPLPREWHSASVAPDGSKVGLVGDGALLIDGTNGQVLREVDGTFGRSFATPGGDVVAFGPPGALWLTSEKRGEGVELKSSSLGMLDETIYLGSWRSLRDPNTATQRYDGPLMITYGSLDPAVTPKPDVAVDSSLFRDWINGADTRMIPIRRLADGRLLLAVGGKPNYSYTTATPEYSPTPWGFFTLDLATKHVEPFGATMTSDNQVHLDNAFTPFDATDDGAVVAGIFGEVGKETPKTLAVFESGKERFRVKLENCYLTRGLNLNRSGSLAAVSVQFPDGSQAIDVFDARSGAVLWYTHIQAEPLALSFVGDDSYVIVTKDGRASRRDGKTGAVRWEFAVPQKGTG